MKKIILVCAAFSLAAGPLKAAETDIQQAFTQIAKEPGSAVFTPPKDWRLADPSKLPSSILAMVVGAGSSEFPPSINLGVHHNSGTLKQFLKFVKETNQSDGIEWTDLGTIRTGAGDASLSQLDTLTEWGPVREMQVIFVKDNTAYILTSAALKNEFSKFYKDFFSSMRSLRINKNVYEMVPDQRRRHLLEEASGEVVKAWHKEAEAPESAEQKPMLASIFESDKFQQDVWAPFTAKLAREFSDMTPEWHSYFLETVKKELK